MTRGERLWRLVRTGPLWRMPVGGPGDVYAYLNESRFGGVLTAGPSVSVDAGLSARDGSVGDADRRRRAAMAYRGVRGLFIDVGRVRIRDGADELLGSWAPSPGRRTWGVLSLHGGADGTTLLHEMVHAALDACGLPNGHGAEFQRVARDVGYDLTADDLAAAARERGPVAAPACWRRR